MWVAFSPFPHFLSLSEPVCTATGKIHVKIDAPSFPGWQKKSEARVKSGRQVLTLTLRLQEPKRCICHLFIYWCRMSGFFEHVWVCHDYPTCFIFFEGFFSAGSQPAVGAPLHQVQEGVGGLPDAAAPGTAW